ncbi:MULTISPECIES: hypothetical protein [Halomicrobium]|uniref:Uncharacterized protein n=1 Tax=Halomicrobium mukohataei (strain ATCC 700874 / DSM 12286 / JCM 9738 / NCIMB 13541) TaxID=485914 RepID=C7P3Z8_HALMD|nr:MULTISPECIES: hypothetical protein [Halomicrobium]ACV47820.1 hypothetical protein Hmuk_1706 [Halomicrobium mukohataei DSM 12286]
MSTFDEDKKHEPELGNGDSLSERLDSIDLDEDDTCSTDDLRDKLDL